MLFLLHISVSWNNSVTRSSSVVHGAGAVEIQDFEIRCGKLSECGKKEDHTGALETSVFASGAFRLCHCAYFPIRKFWKMPENIRISLCFGIVGSVPLTLGPKITAKLRRDETCH